jgi:hypothetical protein
LLRLRTDLRFGKGSFWLCGDWLYFLRRRLGRLWRLDMCWQLRSGATARHLRACNSRFKHYDASRLLGDARFEQANAPARTDAEDKRGDADNQYDKAFQDLFSSTPADR